MRPFLGRLPVVLVALSGCNSTDTGTLQLLTGPETDVLTASPAAVTLKVIALDSNNNATTLASQPASSSTIDLGQQDESNVATIAVEGLDAKNDDVVFGASLPVQYGALAGSTLPIFIQRTNAFARLPGPPSDARQRPTLAIIGERFLVIGAGSGPSDPTSTQIYDFASLGTLGSPPSLPRVPLSMPVVGTVALIIDGSSSGTGGTYYDFSQGTGGDATPPSGYTFADVAGGAVLYDTSTTNGNVYVVGGTRTNGPPTAAVLQIDTSDTSNSNYPTGNLHWLSLTAPRLGAAAVITGRGLVVTGGSTTAAGLEILAKGDTTGSGLPFPPDASIGASASAFANDAQHVLVAGGLTPTGADAGVRKLDLSCTQHCDTMGTETWPSLPVPLSDASTFVLPGDTSALVVGNALPSGATHVYVVDSSDKPTEVKTKVAHSNARAMLSPTSTIVLYGGANDIESFTAPRDL